MKKNALFYCLEPVDEVILNLLYYKIYNATVDGEPINLFEKNGLVCMS